MEERFEKVVYWRVLSQMSNSRMTRTRKWKLELFYGKRFHKIEMVQLAVWSAWHLVDGAFP